MFIQCTQINPQDHDEFSPVTIAVEQIALVSIQQSYTRIRLKSGENVYVDESFFLVCDAINEVLRAQQDGA